jgi:hypothetical protein
MELKIGNKNTWATGEGILFGVGLGFFLLEKSALAFVGSVILGLGLGLIITAVLLSKNN